MTGWSRSSEEALSPPHLIRLSGLALVLGCMLLVITQLVQLYLLFDQADNPGVVGFVGSIALVADPLVVLGLVGLYARLLEAARILGLIAFLIAFFGSAFVIGVYWYDVFVVPSIAPVEAPLYGAALILAYTLLYLGWLLSGVTILRRMRLFPRSAAVLLIVVSLAGGVLSVVQPPGDVPDSGGALPYASVLVNVLFYAIIAWLGFTLWSGGNASEDPTRKPGL